jgi:hypothetical protein
MDTMQTTTLSKLQALADERCDRCNAAGKLRIRVAEGGDLVFCGHHANTYAEQLVKVAMEIWADPEFAWWGADLEAVTQPSPEPRTSYKVV